MISQIRRFSTQRSDALLAQALRLVPQHGWEDSLVLAVREHGMSDQAVSLFNKTDLVSFHYQSQLKRLREFEPKAAPGFDRLKELVLYRLDGNNEIGATRLSEAMALTVRNGAVKEVTRWLGELADEIWYRAGDRSTDTRWYTRRGTLLGAYAASEAFQARDHSKDMRDTRAVAQKLLSALNTTEYAEDSISEWLKFNAIAAFNVAKTWR